MTRRREIDAFVKQIRAAVPDVVSLVDAKAQEIYGGGPEASEAWVFAFQYVTKEAIRANDARQVQNHLTLMVNYYRVGAECVRGCIEGGYVQHLLAGLSSSEKAWGWRLFPPEFQTFYVALCGEPGSVRFENA